MTEQNNQVLHPDLIQYIKLIAQKRDALVVGKQTSDDGRYSFSVHETFEEFAGVDKNTMVLVRSSNGEILIRKYLLSRSELSVFFWIVFIHLRKYYSISTECDEMAWKVVLENYPVIQVRKTFGVFYEEYNKFLESFITPEKEGTPFEQYVLERSLLMNELVAEKIMSMD